MLEYQGPLETISAHRETVRERLLTCIQTLLRLEVELLTKHLSKDDQVACGRRLCGEARRLSEERRNAQERSRCPCILTLLLLREVSDGYNHLILLLILFILFLLLTLLFRLLLPSSSDRDCRGGSDRMDYRHAQSVSGLLRHR